MEKRCHLDCEEYVHIDVFKGICSLKKTKVMADEVGCESFVQTKKCRFCRNYSQTGERLGLCMGRTMAYPDMLANTCEQFQWAKK